MVAVHPAPTHTAHLADKPLDAAASRGQPARRGCEVVSRLAKIAQGLRVDIIDMLAEAGSGHPGGSLSAADIVTALYFHVMRHDPRNPSWPDRDRFVLSKGHCVPAVYAALAECGYFDKQTLKTLRKLGSPLQGHPVSTLCKGIEACTGSLGQGLSIAQGIALAGKIDRASWRVYCMIGDGESQEGQIWEAAMSAPKFKLDNLTVFLDYNKIQLDGVVKETMDLEPLEAKWKAFNWNTLVIDGHDLSQILDAVDAAKEHKGNPTLIIAHTVKGKGVSFMENKVEWHGVAPTREQAEKAIEEIKRKLE